MRIFKGLKGSDNKVRSEILKLLNHKPGATVIYPDSVFNLVLDMPDGRQVPVDDVFIFPTPREFVVVIPAGLKPDVEKVLIEEGIYVLPPLADQAPRKVLACTCQACGGDTCPVTTRCRVCGETRTNPHLILLKSGRLFEADPAAHDGLGDEIRCRQGHTAWDEAPAELQEQRTCQACAETLD